MNRKKLVVSMAVVLILVYAAVSTLDSCRSREEQTEKATAVSDRDGFVGDRVCSDCHRKEFDEWKTSDHYWAMLPPNDTTVLGDFGNTSFTADGVTSTFFIRNGKYTVNTEGPDGRYHDYEIKYTFGVKPLQQYLVEFPGGRMQVLRQCWDVREQKWFHQYPGQQIHHSDWLHWSRGAQNWNAMCSECHSTNLRRNYNVSEDAYNTTWSVMNVSCEACHGPGEKHAAYTSAADYGSSEKVPGSYLVFSKAHSSSEELATCAPCHSRRLVTDPKPFRKLQLLDHYIPEMPVSGIYQADGQLRDEAYEFGSFTQTRMYQHDVNCSDCHNPHSGRLVLTGNALCLQCHVKELDDPSHHFHQANTEAAQCVSCHMPSKYYMVNDLRRDHSFRVPRPDLSAKYGTPNACNGCHSDQNSLWAAAKVSEWYGPDRRYHYSEDLIPASRGDSASVKHLIKLCRADTNIPAVVKATALNYMSLYPHNEFAAHLVEALGDPEPLIRYEATRSLRFYPRELWEQAALPRLSDPVMAVRIAAADLFAEYEPELPPEAQQNWIPARNDLQAFLHLSADVPTGRMMLGNYYSRIKNYTGAEKEFLKSLEMDSLLLPARLSLVTMYNILGRNEDALHHLTVARQIDPANEQVNYYLGLLYVELKDNRQAAQCFATAAKTSRNPRLFYNYGLLLQQMQQEPEAVRAWKKGLALAPNDGDLNYVLAVYYYRKQLNREALPYVLKLLELMPQDQNVKQLYDAVQPQ